MKMTNSKWNTEQQVISSDKHGAISLSIESSRTAEELIDVGTSLPIELSDGMYKAINALISAYDNNDEEKMELYEAIAEDKVTKERVAKYNFTGTDGGYTIHYEVDANEDTKLVSDEEKAQWKEVA